MLTKAKDLSGYSLQSHDGEIGKVKEFYFDDNHWVVRYLVADTGTWLAERLVLLSPYALLKVDKDQKQVAVDLTKKQIEGSPSLESHEPVSQQFETSYFSYYGWPIYWNGFYTWGNSSLIVRHPEKQSVKHQGGKKWNPHLRSSYAVEGYHIQALDGEIGHVKDYIIDDETWEIHYLVVDTRNWLPGRKVLISPKWIESVSWDQSKVFVNLSKDAIKESPEYSEEILLSREYETKLHGHYNRVGYWVK
jgi:sporulation protein YlmC with PRC-barrel domain